MTDLFEPLNFAHGPALPNRFVLAPLTNQQSHADGKLSEEETHWLTMRAQGGFGLVMTAAAFVQPEGKGFEGQLGIHDDDCLPGLEKLAAKIAAEGSRSAVQLYHAGIRAVSQEGIDIVGPSADEETGARAMSAEEIDAMVEAFIVAAQRAERAGFDGVEVHGAHNYIFCAFLSPEFNHREDDYGGSLFNRARPLRAVIDGIQARCGKDFTLGLRLTAEHMGIVLAESRELVRELLDEGNLDYIDMSLWDVFMTPTDERFRDRPLIGWFTDLPRGNTQLGVAGQIRSGPEARRCMDAGADFVVVGRAAIASHDFPKRVRADPDFAMPAPPFSREHLAAEGLSPAFIDYLKVFKGFTEDA